MENFKKATINENAIKNFREQARLAAAKERVVHAALNDAACQVVRVYGPNISMDASRDTLTEIRPSVFSGKIEAQLSVMTGSGLKRIAYPIEIRASEPVLKEDEEVSQEIKAALANTEGELDKKVAEYENKIDNNITAFQEEAACEAKIASLMENEGLSKTEALMKVFNSKTASEQELNIIPGGGIAADSNIGINSLPQPFIRIDKNKLPTFNVGDPLDLEGTPYVCVKVGDTFIEFQLQVL